MSDNYKPFQFTSIDDLEAQKKQAEALKAAKQAAIDEQKKAAQGGRSLSEEEQFMREQMEAIKAEKAAHDKILVVDDDKHFTASLSRLLRTFAYTVEAINDPKDTFLKVSEFQPDLVILDLKMPGMSGSSVAAQLSQHEKTKNIPVIILSGLISVYDSTHNRRTGSNQFFMAKTAEPQEWIEKIKLLINESRVIDQ